MRAHSRDWADDWVIRPNRAHGPFSHTTLSHGQAWVRTGGRGVHGWVKTQAMARGRYVATRSGSNGKAVAHVRYLLRESARAHGLSAPGPFGNCQISSFLTAEKGEKYVWRLVVSPSESLSLDLELYIRIVMGKVAALSGPEQRGQVLRWAAVIHTNTAHPHAHVLIHGLAADGKDVYLKKQTIINLRNLAKATQDNLTGYDLISKDDWLERKLALSTPHMSPRIKGPSLDEHIFKLSKGKTWSEAIQSVRSPERRQALHGRMCFYEAAGVLVQGEDGKLSTNMVQYENFLTGQVRNEGLAKHLRFTPRENLVVNSEATPPSEGVITWIGPDPMGNGELALFESYKGKAQAVPVEDDKLDQAMGWFQSARTMHLEGSRLSPRRGRAKNRAKGLGAPAQLVDQLADFEAEMDRQFPDQVEGDLEENLISEMSERDSLSLQRNRHSGLEF